jgi:hypothetical protein
VHLSAVGFFVLLAKEEKRHHGWAGQFIPCYNIMMFTEEAKQ